MSLPQPVTQAASSAASSPIGLPFIPVPLALFHVLPLWLALVIWLVVGLRILPAAQPLVQDCFGYARMMLRKWWGPLDSR